MSDDTWGPWIEHDGMGCPAQLVPGIYVQLHERGIHGGDLYCHGLFPAHGKDWPGWWITRTDDPRACAILAYRIRRPRGMEVLDSILADLPHPVKEPEHV